MAHHNLNGYDLNWVLNFRNFLLIRHPKDVMLSFLKKFELTSVYQLGYHQQIKLFTFLTNHEKTPIIIDAKDILKNPKMMLKALCKQIEIPFYNEMLSWPLGKRNSDGIWGKYWYENVESSTCFNSYFENKFKLPDKYQKFYSICMNYYEKLYDNRISY